MVEEEEEVRVRERNIYKTELVKTREITRQGKQQERFKA